MRHLLSLSIIVETCPTKQNTNKMRQHFDMVDDDEWWNADECLGIQPSQVMVITRLWRLRGWALGSSLIGNWYSPHLSDLRGSNCLLRWHPSGLIKSQHLSLMEISDVSIIDGSNEKCSPGICQQVKYIGIWIWKSLKITGQVLQMTWNFIAWVGEPD